MYFSDILLDFECGRGGIDYLGILSHRSSPACSAGFGVSILIGATGDGFFFCSGLVGRVVGPIGPSFPPISAALRKDSVLEKGLRWHERKLLLLKGALFSAC